MKKLIFLELQFPWMFNIPTDLNFKISIMILLRKFKIDFITLSDIRWCYYKRLINCNLIITSLAIASKITVVNINMNA